jgi:Ca2+-binding RTX toxin-like protein
MEGAADSTTTARQVGIEGTVLDYTRKLQTSQEVISNRQVPSSSVSLFNDASLSLDLEHLAHLDNRIRSGNASDLLVFRVDELLPLALLAAGRTEAEVVSRSATLDNTRVRTAAGDDLLALEALTNLRFYGLGGSTNTDLVFELLTQGMKDSFASLGKGINTVTINSGFYRSNQGLPLGDVWNLGLDFDFAEAAALRKQANWSFDLTARAVGMEGSELVFGDDNDELTIFTRIDEDLSRQLGKRYADPGTRIQLERIGMLDSSVQMGAGNDTVRVNGAVINSVIDLGEGNNTLVLEESLGEGSRVLMGKGANQVTINSMLGGLVRGGAGDEVFLFEDQILAGELNGGRGFDVLRGSTLTPGNRDVVTINGRDQGFFNGLRFRNIQELDTGAGNDVVIFNFNASLTGRLLGGDGLDRLEFLSWQSPVSVDLDLGQASAIFSGQPGGISGFEAATGGAGNDLLAASGRHRGLAGGGGSDTFLLRWSPWESPARTGLIVGLNPQSDRLVLSGLEARAPRRWDGRFGLPVIEGLDLAEAEGVSDQILWERQSGVLRLTPSGSRGVGDARLLPIAPLESLLSGMDSRSGLSQLAVNTTPLLNAGGNPAELVLLGAPGPDPYRTIALLPEATLGVHTPRNG